MTCAFRRRKSAFFAWIIQHLCVCVHGLTDGRTEGAARIDGAEARSEGRQQNEWVQEAPVWIGRHPGGQQHHWIYGFIPVTVTSPICCGNRERQIELKWDDWPNEAVWCNKEILNLSSPAVLSPLLRRVCLYPWAWVVCFVCWWPRLYTEKEGSTWHKEELITFWSRHK